MMAVKSEYSLCCGNANHSVTRSTDFHVIGTHSMYLIGWFYSGDTYTKFAEVGTNWKLSAWLFFADFNVKFRLYIYIYIYILQSLLIRCGPGASRTFPTATLPKCCWTSVAFSTSALCTSPRRATRSLSRSSNCPGTPWGRSFCSRWARRLTRTTSGLLATGTTTLAASALLPMLTEGVGLMFMPNSWLGKHC